MAVSGTVFGKLTVVCYFKKREEKKNIAKSNNKERGRKIQKKKWVKIQSGKITGKFWGLLRESFLTIEKYFDRIIEERY
jgi:hypothetical protein